MVGLITPRPIAWVSSVSPSGVANLAPFSFFNGVAASPPTLLFSAVNRRDGSPKDTVRNVEATGEFVVNVVSHDLRVPMNATSEELPYETSELEACGLVAVASERVRPPRVAGVKAAFECERPPDRDAWGRAPWPPTSSSAASWSSTSPTRCWTPPAASIRGRSTPSAASAARAMPAPPTCSIWPRPGCEAEHPAEEGQLGFVDRADGLGPAKAVLLAREGVVLDRQSLGAQGLDQSFGLVGRHHLVVQSLEEDHRAAQSIGMGDGRALGVQVARARPAARPAPSQ